MRIITGNLRWRNIEAPNGKGVRPTGDKVKGSIFNIIRPFIDGSICLDLFAGSGNLGLEAISSGADKCYFVDNSRESIKYIHKNVESCNVSDKSVIICSGYERALKKIGEKVDIIFIDPPYYGNLYIDSISRIDFLDLLSDDGIIIAEHDSDIELPEIIASFNKFKEKKYGRVMVSFYKK